MQCSQHAALVAIDRTAPISNGKVSAESLLPLLRSRFGLDRLHGWQAEAIEAVLRPGGRVLVVAPTGGGKSLCYQLPAVALGGTTLVVSPLISLMQDQVRSLERAGIAATYFASTTAWEENRRRLTDLRSGRFTLVYAAPERLAHAGFIEALAEAELALVAVDEAHCIVQWGHDFRPDYLRLGQVLATLRPPRVIACTATATPEARAEILTRLRLVDDHPDVILRGFARPNLHLAVREVSGPRDGLDETVRALSRALRSPAQPSGAAIVYAATRKNTERIAEQLMLLGWSARAYHAGLDADRRGDVAKQFADQQLPIVVATNAFGMGIDRPDVRLVVHAQPPASLEAYYQEVGRAGRDGAPADGVLLVAPGDIALRRRLCAMGADGGEASAVDAARAWTSFRELLRYVDAASCRHDFILRYFGDEAESLGGCGHCDVCRSVDAVAESDPEVLARDADVIRRALAGVARAKGAAGMQTIADMLRGEGSAVVRRIGLDRLSTFGVLAGRTQDEILRVMRVLFAAGWIEVSSDRFPVVTITRAGWSVMMGEQPIRVRLPRADAQKAVGRASVPRRKRPSSGVAAGRSEDKAAEATAAAADGALRERLREHRASVAKELGVPAYVVATNRTLDELALLCPRSLDEMSMVHGMGPRRVEQFGRGFLDVLRAH